MRPADFRPHSLVLDVAILVMVDIETFVPWTAQEGPRVAIIVMVDIETHPDARRFGDDVVAILVMVDIETISLIFFFDTSSTSQSLLWWILRRVFSGDWSKIWTGRNPCYGGY